MSYLNTAAQPAKILIVEDYEDNILVTKLYLEKFGYSYEIAKNGDEAVEKVKSEDFSTILMDVRMQGLCGIEATKYIREHEIRASKKRTPIIGMTANALQGDRERCLDAGMDDYLTKPFRPEEFEQKLITFTGLKRHAA